jgi:CxxC motif-containing protein
MVKEICNECSKSVKTGSGIFTNRIPDFNDYITRIEMNKPFPEGDYICTECYDYFNPDLSLALFSNNRH